MLPHVYLLIMMVLPRVTSNLDYWSAEYDSNKNCKQEDKILQLRNKVRKNKLRNKRNQKIKIKINSEIKELKIKINSEIKNRKK